MLVFLICGRIFASSWIKVLQKQLANHGLGSLLIGAVSFLFLSVLVTPALFAYPPVGLSLVFWTSIVIAILIDTPGNLVLVKAVSMTDLSLIGPLNAYKPMVGLVMGIFWLDEIPTLWGLIGVVIIFLGSAFLSPSGERFGYRALLALVRDRGVQLAFLAMVMTAAAAIYVKAAVVASSPIDTIIWWTLLSTPVSLLGLFLLSPDTLRTHLDHVRTHIGSGILLAVAFLGMQLCTIYLLNVMYVAYALALFQLSSIVNVILGYRIFKEQNVLSRALGSVIMIVGAAILIIAG